MWRMWRDGAQSKDSGQHAKCTNYYEYQCMLCSGWSCRRPRYLQRCPGRVESSPVTSPVHMFVCGFPQNLSITFHYYGRGYNLRGLETAFGAKSVISKCTHHHHHRVMARITGIIDRFEAVIDLSTFVGDRNMISRLDNGQCIDTLLPPLVFCNWS